MYENRQHTTETSIFARPLGSLTALCCQYPAAVLVLTALISAACLYWAYEHLGLKMSRLDLINPQSSFNQLWLDYIDEFGDNNEVIVVVQGSNNDGVITILEKLTDKIKPYSQFYQDTLAGVDLAAIHRKGLHYIPVEDLQKIQQFAAQALPMFEPRNFETGNFDPRNPSVVNFPLFSQGQHPMEGMDNVSNLLTTLGQSNTGAEDMNYFLFPTKEGVMGLVLLRLVNIDKTQFSQGTEAIETLRSLVEEIRTEHSGFQIGLTGMPILEYDEMAMSNDAMLTATVLALVGVCIVFMAGFGSLRHPLLALIALMAAFAWTMGYITLAVGHLNILSIAFGAMLIGLGTDFSVHFLGKYLDLRNKGGDVFDSLCQSAELVGPGIVTGALTTSAAFYTASFTEFTGVAELGIIVGGGILFCVITTFTVLPALITLITPTKSGKGGPSGSLIDIRDTLAPVFVFPKITLFLFLLGFAYLLLGLPNVRYDHNLLNLQPKGLESVELEHKLLSMDVEQGGKNVWFALSIADSKEELLERKKLFEQKYPELNTEEIVSYFPDPDPERIRIIQSLADMLVNLPEQLPEMLSSQVPPQVSPQVSPQIAAQMSAQTAQMTELLNRLQSLKAMANPEPPTVKDLPDSLITRFVGQSGKQLMRIYTSANIWDMEEMQKFVESVRDIDPNATGSPLQTYESSLQMQVGFIMAAWYALAAVLLLTFLDFRSITASFAAILPMLLGATMTFGILGLLDLPLNPANMIVLPLVIGISIDHGVHILHDFRNRQNRRYVISSSTATAILITTLTTFVSFGSMMTASHQGLQSLGRVFVIGAACCLITSIVVLPAILTWWTKGNQDEPLLRPPEKPKRLVRRGE